MIVTRDPEVRVDARTLLTMPGEQLRVQPGGQIGLVGRNGANKTTTMHVLSSGTEPYSDSVVRSGPIGYLPQSSCEGDTDISARDHVLSVQGLNQIRHDMDRQQEIMETATTGTKRDTAIRKFSHLKGRYHDLGGYETSARTARICDALGLPERVLDQPLKMLSGDQHRRVELVQIPFATAEGSGRPATTLLLDEPTNRPDADSVTQLREFLSKHEDDLIIISHDVELLEAMCNRVWFLDAVRVEADVYNMGRRNYLSTRATDGARRCRESASTGKKASTLRKQTEKLGTKAAKARAVKQMVAHAERMMDSPGEIRVADKIAHISFPEPVPCDRTPLNATGLTRVYDSLEVFAGMGLAIDKGSCMVVLGFNGAGKTTLLKLLAGVERTDGEGGIVSGYGLRIDYFAQEHDTIDPNKTAWENTVYACPDVSKPELRSLLDAFMFSGDKLQQPAGTLSGDEKTRPTLATLVSSHANILLPDGPTNNLDPQSHEQVLDALRTYTGAVVLVTHDPGAVRALEPECVIVLPNGTEDL